MKTRQRLERIAQLTAFVAVVLALAGATPAPALSIAAPARLYEGDHVELVLTLSLPPGAGAPLLVTPSSEGAAVEVARGRLLRSDARDRAANPLVFDLPIIAARPGTAVLRVRALAYVCERACKAVEVEAQRTLLVLAK